MDFISSGLPLKFGEAIWIYNLDHKFLMNVVRKFSWFDNKSYDGKWIKLWTLLTRTVSNGQNILFLLNREKVLCARQFPWNISKPIINKYICWMDFSNWAKLFMGVICWTRVRLEEAPRSFKLSRRSFPIATTLTIPKGEARKQGSRQHIFQQEIENFLLTEITVKIFVFIPPHLKIKRALRSPRFCLLFYPHRVS